MSRLPSTYPASAAPASVLTPFVNGGAPLPSPGPEPFDAQPTSVASANETVSVVLDMRDTHSKFLAVLNAPKTKARGRSARALTTPCAQLRANASLSRGGMSLCSASLYCSCGLVSFA